jgi:DNA-directed RNA polymerase specialized sigma24 family protein
MMGMAAEIFTQSVREAQTKREHAESFNDCFARSRPLLHLIACRILGDSERADLTVRNSRLRASRNSPIFSQQGEFRSWLLRILINEALAIRLFGKRQQLCHERFHPGTWKERNAG